MSCFIVVFIVLIIIAALVCAYFYFTKKTVAVGDTNTKPCYTIKSPECNVPLQQSLKNQTFQIADDTNQYWLQLSQHDTDCGTKWLVTPFGGSSDQNDGSPGVFRFTNVNPSAPNVSELQVQTPDGSNTWQSLYIDYCHADWDRDSYQYLTVAKAEDGYVPTCTPCQFTWLPTDVPDTYSCWISGGSCDSPGSFSFGEQDGVWLYGNGYNSQGSAVNLGFQWI